MKIAVIPARGGSKRIPRKNVRKFHGKPMIGWAIEAAHRSGCFDHVIVSTDDAEIAEIAHDFDALCPFVRPQNLADDFTPLVPVVRHALTETMAELGAVDHVCCILPTAPLMRSSDLRDCYGILQRGRNTYVLPVTSFPYPIQRAVKKLPDGRIAMFEPDHYLIRSQDLEEAFHDAGQFYWASTETWMVKDQLFDKDAFGFEIPRSHVQDIDTMEDWHYAEMQFSLLNKLNVAALSDGQERC